MKFYCRRIFTPVWYLAAQRFVWHSPELPELRFNRNVCVLWLLLKLNTDASNNRATAILALLWATSVQENTHIMREYEVEIFPFVMTTHIAHVPRLDQLNKRRKRWKPKYSKTHKIWHNASINSMSVCVLALHTSATNHQNKDQIAPDLSHTLPLCSWMTKQIS